jgi:hypothetical protein
VKFADASTSLANQLWAASLGCPVFAGVSIN